MTGDERGSASNAILDKTGLNQPKEPTCSHLPPHIIPSSFVALPTEELSFCLLLAVYPATSKGAATHATSKHQRATPLISSVHEVTRLDSNGMRFLAG